MNNIVRLILDENNDVKKIVIINSEIKKDIDLTQEVKNKIFKLLINSKNKYKHRTDGYNTIYVFNKLDKKDIVSIENGDVSQLSQRRKVKRTNIYSNKKIICTGAIIALLLAYNIHFSNKDINENISSIKPPVNIGAINQESISQEKTISNNTENNNFIQIDIECSSINDSDYTKYQYTKENYFDLISNIANTYGIDPKLVLAIATQERSKHSQIIDEGGGLGLMQIQFTGWSWEGKEVSAYNFDKNIWETITINEEDAKDLETNIKYGCFILANSLREHNYNLLQALQGYNSGKNAVDSAIQECSIYENISIPNIINDQTNTRWLSYRKNYGDPEYIENVLKYINKEDNKILLKKVDQNGNTSQIALEINKLSKGKTM